jgi:hypothetical protein
MIFPVKRSVEDRPQRIGRVVDRGRLMLELHPLDPLKKILPADRREPALTKRRDDVSAPIGQGFCSPRASRLLRTVCSRMSM